MKAVKPSVAVLLFAVLVTQTIIWLGHWLLYKTVVFAFSLDGWEVRTWFRSSVFVLGTTFMVAQMLVVRLRKRWLDVFYRIAAVWIGTAHILLLAAGVFWIIAAIAFRTGMHMPWRTLSLGLCALALIIDVYAIRNSFNTRVTKYDVRLPNLPPAWRGRTAVVASDMHFGNIRGVKSSEKLVRMINEEKPDIVFLPGDFFDGPLADYPALAAPLSDIRARFGTYFIEGNHEEFSDPAPYLAALRAANVNIFDGDVVDLEGLQILGLAYRQSETKKDLKEALGEIPFDRERPSILMKHSPSVRRTAAAAGISLMLSGHTHNGQMWPFNLFARWLFGKATYGHSEKDGMQIITSSGFGTWGPPQRLGSKAEIVVIKFL